MKKEIPYWRILYYICTAILLIWILLKSIGIIQTPFWLLYGIPATTVVLGALALYSDLLKNINKIAIGFATLATKFDYLEKDMSLVKSDITSMKKDISFLKKTSA